MKITLAVILALSVLPTHAVVRSWTNTLGGNWFVSANWSPNGVPSASDAVQITNNGTYSVLVATGAVSSFVLTIGGGSGTQTLIYGTSSGQYLLTNNSVVRANGVLTVTNSGLRGALTVQTGGQLNLAAASGLHLYNLALTNHGTVTWSNGTLSVGGSNSETTYITNNGLWEITGNNSMGFGGGSRPLFLNSGTVRKFSGAAQSAFSGVDFINLPAGVVNVESGVMQFVPIQTNVLGGTFTVNAPGSVTLFNGTFIDAGGTLLGNGTMQFSAGTLILRTNVLAGLKLVGGDVYLGANTFQQSGTITNLTLDGAKLHGTNRVAGILTFNSGSLVDHLTILPGGELLMGLGGNKLLYDLFLFNQGTVSWSGSSLNVGGNPGTVISNGGSWIITGDATMGFGGGQSPVFTNAGTVRKSGGSGTSAFSGVTFANLPSGLVQVDTGTLQFPNFYTNTAGTLRLNGGTFASFNGMTLAGGTVDGTGSFSTSLLVTGGNLSPGNSPGAIRFTSGLHLATNSTLVIDGNGTTPGTQCDQLSIATLAAVTNCTLQVTALPVSPVGTAFAILTNTSGSAISGGFKDLPDKALFNVGAQTFRIHYNFAGNNVLLVRDSGATAPQWQVGTPSYSNGVVRLTGAGGSAMIYTIQATTNFLQWTNIGSATGNLSGNFIFTDTNAFRFPYRFYRAAN
jgi:hypothetical protein